MYPDSWIYLGFKSCNFDLWWKQNGGHHRDLCKIHGFKLIIYAQTALIWKFQNAVCTATLRFDKCHYIRSLRAEFAAKHGKASLSLTKRWWMEPDFGSCQSPDISRSHLYRCTIAWTPPTVIYREYTAHSRYQIPRNLPMVPALLCCGVVTYTWFYPYPSRLLHWHWGKCIFKLNHCKSFLSSDCCKFHRWIPWDHLCRDQSVYASSQWEMALHCNAIFHWLGT